MFLKVASRSAIRDRDMLLVEACYADACLSAVLHKLPNRAAINVDISRSVCSLVPSLGAPTLTVLQYLNARHYSAASHIVQ